MRPLWSLPPGLVIWLACAASAHAQAPTDQRLREQWAVAPGSVLNLPAAWALSQGAGVVVAVIDSGTRLEHPDLAPNVWTNFGEVPGNGVDDDGNGYVDDVHGVDLTTTGAAQDLSDGNGHGTHVAGIIAAAANGRGVVGVAYRAADHDRQGAQGRRRRHHGGARGGHPLRRRQRRPRHQHEPRRRRAGRARPRRDRAPPAPRTCSSSARPATAPATSTRSRAIRCPTRRPT